MSGSRTREPPPGAVNEALTERGRLTRSRILDAALELFRERGYEQTTMRRVAREAGVSLGNAYYYFRSKEHLIQGYYARSHDDHLAACTPILERETGLRTRLRGVLEAKIATSAAYHQFAGALFKTAADPRSPLSPFSDESEPTRREATRLLERVVEGSDVRVSGDLARELPHLLWLYLMGVILFWIHDDSPRTRRTYRLIEHTSSLVARLIRLAGNPLLRPLTDSTLRLLRELREDGEGPGRQSL
ncbi:MAG: TetR family transcriptional regulator [Acidobacteriota bacterium]